MQKSLNKKPSCEVNTVDRGVYAANSSLHIPYLIKIIEAKPYICPTPNLKTI
jgi:hypothetical protein